MEIQWVFYQSLGKNLQSDFEKIMIYTDPSQGIYMEDMYRYMSDICMIYANIYAIIYAKTVQNSTRKEDVDSLYEKVYEETYRKNEDFWGELKNVFEGKKYITLKEAEEFLPKFQVPKT